MRGCAEVVEVRVDSAGRPAVFRRGARSYEVVTYLHHWRARTSWWKQSGAPEQLRLEDVMWRVEAASGGHRGVFELRDASPTWSLVGIMD